MTANPSAYWQASVLDYFSPDSGYYRVQLSPYSKTWQALWRRLDGDEWEPFAVGLEDASEAIAMCLDDMARVEELGQEDVDF